jgi:hypothetical protein
MLYVQCLLFRITIAINPKFAMQRAKTLPKSSPGRAVKPAARQPVERDQIVGCGTSLISHTSAYRTRRERG